MAAAVGHAVTVGHEAVAGHEGVAGHAAAAVHEKGEGQQHPIAIYLWIWALLFIFSTFSYLIDYFHLRLALKFAILIPPLCLLVLIGLMAIEGDYTFLTRLGSFLH